MRSLQPDLRRVTPRCATIALAVTFLACNPMGRDFLGPDTDCLLCIQPTEPTPYALFPDSVNVLLRDTISAFTWKCPTGCTLDFPPVASAWTISGGAMAAVDPARLAGASRVLLRASATGEALLTATSLEDPTLQRTARIRVADSSTITSIRLHTCCGATDTVVSYGDVLSDLVDQQMRRYRAVPTAWSVSDTSLVTLGADSRFSAGARSIRVKKAGTVEIRASFLAVEGRILVVVRP